MTKGNFENNLILIGEAAELLGVSMDTLRRWDKSGRFRATKRSSKGTRYYSEEDIKLHLNDLFKIARDWVFEKIDISEEFYCSTSAIFQARLTNMQNTMNSREELKEIVPLVVSVTGEIGNNSFDHNLGNWSDVPGVFFGYDLNKRHVVLADRGQGVLKTLKRVRPKLAIDKDALRVAFTEIVSGRAPENRGNGLKYVRRVVVENLSGLFFQSGNAILKLKRGDPIKEASSSNGAGKKEDLEISESEISFHGTLALITF